jgi:phosphatidylglycerophosphate synthase
MSSNLSKKEKLRNLIKLPAHQSDWEFTSILISRPINFLLLMVMGDLSFITPNIVTILGFLSFLGASALIYLSPHSVVLISILLFLRLILDDLDGMLARYRGGGSFFGSYLDKITDVIGFFVFFTMIGLTLYKSTGEIKYLLISHFATFSLITTGYVKWVVESYGSKPVKSTTKTPVLVKPWWKVLGILLFIKLPVLNECDIFILSITLILLGKPHWLLWALAVSQGIQMVAMVIIRGLKAHSIDSHG